MLKTISLGFLVTLACRAGEPSLQRNHARSECARLTQEMVALLDGVQKAVANKSLVLTMQEAVDFGNTYAVITGINDLAGATKDLAELELAMDAKADKKPIHAAYSHAEDGITARIQYLERTFPSELKLPGKNPDPSWAALNNALRAKLAALKQALDTLARAKGN